MKKTYITPATYAEQSEVEQMIAASITGVGGDSGLGIGDGDAPDEADVKADNWDEWGDED